MAFFLFSQNGILSALPYLAMWLFSMFISVIADWMIYSERFNHTSTRKIINSIGKLIDKLPSSTHEISDIFNFKQRFHNLFALLWFRSIQSSHLPYHCLIHWLQSSLDRGTTDAGRWTQRWHLFRVQDQPLGHYAAFCWHSDGVYKLHSQFGRSVGTNCCWASDWRKSK